MDKLNSEELTYAKEEILRLSAIPQNEVLAKIKEEQKEEVYMNLSMVDSYILHIISVLEGSSCIQKKFFS